MKKLGSVPEYRDGFERCSDCGGALADGPAPAASRPAGATAVPAHPASDATRRLLVTLGAVALAAVGARVPLAVLPLAGLSGLFGGETEGGSIRLLSLGLGPFFLSFQLVEWVAVLVPPLRARRHAGFAARATLRSAAMGLGLVGLVLQAAVTARWVGSMGDGIEAAPPFAPLVAVLVASHLALLGLVWVVDQRGLGNGFAVVWLGLSLPTVLRCLLGLAFQVGSSSVTPGGALVAVVLVGGASGLLVWWATRPPSSEGQPAALPFPIATLMGPQAAGALLSLPATLSAFVPALAGVTAALTASRWLYQGLFSFVAVDLTLLLGFLFFRPRRVGRIWAERLPGVDAVGAVARARALLPRALLFSVVAALVLSNVGWLQVDAIGSRDALPADVLVSALLVLDLVLEWRSRRAMGRLVAVWPIYRGPEVEPTLEVLRQAGISAHVQSAHWFMVFQFFAPWVPATVLVPERQAPDARALLERR